MANKGEDLINYKGMYFNDDTTTKNIDESTGAHFQFHDMCRRLKNLIETRHKHMQRLKAWQAQFNANEDGPKHQKEKNQEETDAEKKQKLLKEKEEFVRQINKVISHQQNQESEKQKAAPKPEETKTQKLAVKQTSKIHHLKITRQPQKNLQERAMTEETKPQGLQPIPVFVAPVVTEIMPLTHTKPTPLKVLNLNNETQNSSTAHLLEKGGLTQSNSEVLHRNVSKTESQVQQRRSSNKNARVQQIQRMMQAHHNAPSSDTGKSSNAMVIQSQAMVGPFHPVTQQEESLPKNNSILTRHQQAQLILLEQQQRSKSNESNVDGQFSGIVGLTSQTFNAQNKKHTALPEATVSQTRQALQQFQHAGNKKKQNQRQATVDQVTLKTTGEVVGETFSSKSPILAGGGSKAGKAQHIVGAKNQSSVHHSDIVLRTESNKRRKTPDTLGVHKGQAVRRATGGGAPSGSQVIAMKNQPLGRGGSVYLQNQTNESVDGTPFTQHSNSQMQQNRKFNQQLVTTQDAMLVQQLSQGSATNQSQSYQQSLASNRKIRTRSSQRSNRALQPPGGQQNLTDMSQKVQQRVHTHHATDLNVGGIQQPPPRNHLSLHQQTSNYMNNPSLTGQQQQNIVSRNHDKPVGSQTFYGHQISFKSTKSQNQPEKISQIKISGNPQSQSALKNTTSGGSIISQPNKSKNIVRGNFSGIPASQLSTQQQPVKSRNGPGGTMIGQLRMGGSVGITGGSSGGHSVGSNMSAGLLQQQATGSGYSLVQKHLGEGSRPMKIQQNNKVGTYQNSTKVVNAQLRGSSTGSAKDNQHLYKMIFPQNKRPQKNIASSYLRGIESQMSGGTQGVNQINQQSVQGQNRQQMLANVQVGTGSSRNQGMLAPASTQKTRSIGGGSHNSKLNMGVQPELRKSYYQP